MPDPKKDESTPKPAADTPSDRGGGLHREARPRRRTRPRSRRIDPPHRGTPSRSPAEEGPRRRRQKPEEPQAPLPKPPAPRPKAAKPDGEGVRGGHHRRSRTQKGAPASPDARRSRFPDEARGPGDPPPPRPTPPTVRRPQPQNARPCLRRRSPAAGARPAEGRTAAGAAAQPSAPQRAPRRSSPQAHGKGW